MADPRQLADPGIATDDTIPSARRANASGHVVPRELPLRAGSESVRQFLNRFKSSRRAVFRALRQLPAVVDAARQLDAKTLYIIEWPQDAIDALKGGHGVWKEAADQSFEAAIRAKDGGRFIKHLRLREAGGKGIDLTSLNNIAVQASLAEIIGRLEELGTKVDAVLLGQSSDRRAQVEAGEHIYLQALHCQQLANREHLLRQAVGPLTVGRSQLIQSIETQSSILRPPTGGAPLWGDTPTQKLQAAFGELRTDLQATMAATQTLTLIHEELREPEAAREALRQLTAGFLESAPRLRQLARYVPYSIKQDHEQTWLRVQEHIMPAAEATLHRMSPESRDDLTALEFVPADVLEGDTDDDL
jgi:hypothetical protein